MAACLAWDENRIERDCLDDCLVDSLECCFEGTESGFWGDRPTLSSDGTGSIARFVL